MRKFVDGYAQAGLWPSMNADVRMIDRIRATHRWADEGDSLTAVELKNSRTETPNTVKPGRSSDQQTKPSGKEPYEICKPPPPVQIGRRLKTFEI